MICLDFESLSLSNIQMICDWLTACAGKITRANFYLRTFYDAQLTVCRFVRHSGTTAGDSDREYCAMFCRNW